ncbi:SapB/AmfS family lanthipeptide [Nucisporomicrobium flavum]|jgi:Lanthionine-containing peptide SapB precursor RamS|nr:SapB/AmfS family lanthipeptide [Nucisporomicrobium flavum]
MALLDLQGMELTTEQRNGGGGGSRASLLLCGDSSLSVTTCN